MTVRSLATAAAGTAVLALGGAALVSAPALADGADVARAAAVHAYAGFPAGATARVHSVSTPSGRTTVTLTVTGLEPGRTYGAHAHVSPCSASDPLAAGGHWQHVPGVVDARNEVWLDVTADAEGNGRSKAVQDFAFSGGHRPASVIIHAQPTAADGTAGARLACVTVGF